MQEENEMALETISARVAARLFHCTTQEFYELTLDSGVCIREVPDRPSIEFREWCLTQTMNPHTNDEWEPWHYIPPSKIVYRLDDFMETYELFFGEEPRIPKHRIKREPPKGKRVDRVTRTIEELIAAGKLSQSFTHRLPARDWIVVRALVLERDDYTCQYCGKCSGTMHVDHVVPVARGGNDMDNLVTACQGCNLQKHARTPEEWLS